MQIENNPRLSWDNVKDSLHPRGRNLLIVGFKLAKLARFIGEEFENEGFAMRNTAKDFVIILDPELGVDWMLNGAYSRGDGTV